MTRRGWMYYETTRTSTPPGRPQRADSASMAYAARGAGEFVTWGNELPDRGASPVGGGPERDQFTVVCVSNVVHRCRPCGVVPKGQPASQ